MSFRIQRLQITASILLLVLPTAMASAQRGAPAAPRTPPINPSTDPFLRTFQWRSIGPAGQGGRVDDIAVASNARTYYVGYATGGLWKTVNGGTTFESVFDTYGNTHIGAVAVAPSDSDVVYIASGEGNNRNSSSYGDGVYKSTDGAKTFSYVGLREGLNFNCIVVNPRNPNIVYVGALGSLFGSNAERGVYRTTDGGKAWTRVLFVDENTGANDIVLDPSDPNTIYASMYQRRRTAWGYNGGGPGSGIWKSTDGGAHWSQIKAGGLPGGQEGRIALDVSRSNPNVVYAQIEVLRDEERVGDSDRVIAAGGPTTTERGAVVGDHEGGIWRSNDKGRTWEYRSNHNVRPGYFSNLKIDPKNPDVVYTAGRQFYRSEDGARTFHVINGPGHGDYHAIWIDPSNSDHVMVGNDGGFDVSYDRARTFEAMRPNAVGQFYGVSVDMRRPYFVCGGLQDNSSWCGPSAVGAPFISAHDWYNVGNGDGQYTANDPTDYHIVYAEGQRGTIRRLDIGQGEAVTIQPRVGTPAAPSNITPRPAAGEHFRWNWTAPFILSPHNPHTLYLGGNRLFKSVDRGNSWTMSPDLTKQIDPNRQQIFGVMGSVKDCHDEGPISRGQPCILSKNDGTWFYSTITTISESPLVPDLIWVGTDDGNVQVSRDGLANWTNVAANISGAPQNCVVSRVEASHFEANGAFVSLDCHYNNDMRPYVYATRDLGRTWTPITSDLPTFGDVRVVKQDLKNPSLLYAGTEFGLFVSLDAGKSWKPFMTGLPHVRVDDIVIHPRDGDLILGTHGRSVYIMDDVTPLQELSAEVLAQDVYFFEPRTTTFPRTQQYLSRSLPASKQFRGTNPEPGVAFQYYLKQAAQGAVKLTVADAVTGRVIRTLNGTSTQGLNRVQWNLMPDGQRQAAAADSDEPPVAPVLARPGTYRVSLTVNGVEHTRGLRIEDNTSWLSTTNGRHH
jgi:photosystem II stability/assembly factor-like uncharacterized protein